MPNAKTREVLSIQAGVFGPAACEQALAEALRAHCLGLTGNEHRDVRNFEAKLEDDGLYVLGYHGEVRRVFFHLELDQAPSEVGIELRATKGPLDVLDADWGSTGPQIGNSVLIARLLHVGICTLRSQGVGALVNNPTTRAWRLATSRWGSSTVGDCHSRTPTRSIEHSASSAPSMINLASTSGRRRLDDHNPFKQRRHRRAC